MIKINYALELKKQSKKEITKEQFEAIKKYLADCQKQIDEILPLIPDHRIWDYLILGKPIDLNKYMEKKNE